MGRTLRDQLDAGEVTPSDLGSYALQLARALAFLSAKRSTAHLDLKPSNILVTTDKVLKVSDFGLARSVALFQNKPAPAWAGSPGYMAPEQMGTSYVDERSDVFAFGAILHEILTGTPRTAPAKKLYWEGLPRASLQPPFREELEERTLNKLGRLLGGCLDELSDRIQSFAAVVRGVETIFRDIAPPMGEDEQPAAKVQRARSWQVIGEHSRALRELNRLLLLNPNLPGADQAVERSLEALRAVTPDLSPQLMGSAKTCEQVLGGDTLRQFVFDSTRANKYATALRVVLAALRRSPGDESILTLAALVVRQGMSRSTHFEAAVADEELDEQILANPLLDAIFCECSEPECGAAWIPLGELLRGALHAHVLNMVGGRCRKCGRVFCRKHFGHSQMGVDASTVVCRYDGSPLESIEKATGRRRRREAEATTPCRHVLFMREGPVTPDIPYVTKGLDALVPGSLSAETIISPQAVTKWANLRIVARGFLEHLSGFDEDLTVETTDAVLDGDRVFIARTFASPSAVENTELRGLGGPRRTVQRSGQAAASSVGDAVIAELEQAVAALRAARASGYSGIDDALRPTGIAVLRFSAGQGRPFLVHTRLLSHLAAEGLLSNCNVFKLDMADASEIVGFIFITGPVDAMKAYPRAYYAREAETFVERECDGQWSRIQPACSATDIPAPGCALELTGAVREFDALFSTIRAERESIIPLR